MKKRQLLIAICIALVLIVVGFLVSLSRSTTTAVYTVVKQGHALCTQDVPSSECSDWSVTLKNAGGQQKVFVVPGYTDAGGRKTFDAISSIIASAKDEGTSIRVTTAHGSIQSVEVLN